MHPITHWEDGATTATANLLALCQFHHRLHHPGGLGVTANADEPDGVVLTDERGRPLAACSRPVPPGERPWPPGTWPHPAGERDDRRGSTSTNAGNRRSRCRPDRTGGVSRRGVLLGASRSTYGE